MGGAPAATDDFGGFGGAPRPPLRVATLAAWRRPAASLAVMTLVTSAARPRRAAPAPAPAMGIGGLGALSASDFCDAAPASAEGAAPEDPEVLAKGLECYYTDKKTGETVPVKILKVHFDDPPPYYSIKMPDGNERETVRERLRSSRRAAAAAAALRARCQMVSRTGEVMTRQPTACAQPADAGILSRMGGMGAAMMAGMPGAALSGMLGAAAAPAAATSATLAAAPLRAG